MHARQQRPFIRRLRFVPTTCQAMIFPANNDDTPSSPFPSDTAWYTDDNSQSSGERFRPLADDLIRKSSDRLARLAVAFSPPERRVALEDIDQIQVSALDEDHINIEAILCEQDGCVSLSIPVSFPDSCRDSAQVEECIVTNMDDLDIQASQAQEHTNEHTLTNDLCVAENFSYPDWWAVAQEHSLISECVLLRNLLNEVDFSEDLQKLTQRALETTHPGNYKVGRAGIVNIGPADTHACSRFRVLIQG